MPKASHTSAGASHEGAASKETSEAPAFADKRKSSTKAKNLKGRNSSDDLNSPGQQVITLTVGSRVEKPGGGKAALSSGKDIITGEDANNEADANSGVNGSIRVDIPDRDVYDQSVAATEQNKASVVSEKKISSANSSAMNDLGATS